MDKINGYEIVRKKEAVAMHKSVDGSLTKRTVGRPRKPGYHQYGFKISSYLHKEIIEYCKRNKCGFSEFIRNRLEKLVKKHERRQREVFGNI